jgi:hypothetical protein
MASRRAELAASRGEKRWPVGLELAPGSGLAEQSLAEAPAGAFRAHKRSLDAVPATFVIQGRMGSQAAHR